MASCTDVVEAIAKKLRPKAFRWNRANFDKLKAPYSLLSYERDQARITGLVREVLNETERLGYRIVRPNEAVTPAMLTHLTRMRELGYSATEILAAQITMVKPLFPMEEIHGHHKKKFFVKLKD